MREILMPVLLAALISTSVSAVPPDDKAKCEKIKQQIRAIEAKMRNGYSAAQGIRYEERLRALKEKRYKVCR